MVKHQVRFYDQITVNPYFHSSKTAWDKFSNDLITSQELNQLC